MSTSKFNAKRWKHENGGIIRFQPGGTVKLDDYGYPADITPAIITQDSEFNKFLMTLPDNLRLTPEKDYHMYDYWKLSGKPENFKEGKRRGMFTWDNSDKGYHAGSIAEDRNTGIYHFMKPKHHPTVKYELDWFNKGLQTLEGGKQVPVEGKDKEFWKDFTSKYQLDTTGVDYRYVPIKKNGGILKAQEGTGNGFWPKLWNAVKEGGLAARDAKLGAVGAQQVRDLYSEGKNQEAQDLAKQYAKANTTGISLAGGVASANLLGDLMVTGATTATDAFIDGDVKNFGKNLAKNYIGDFIGKGIDVTPSLYKWIKNSANDVLNIHSFDDSLDSAIEFYKTHINPDIKKTDFDIWKKKWDLKNTRGEYRPNDQLILLRHEENPNFTSHFDNRGILVHEMRHHEDVDLHNSNTDYGSFTIEKPENKATFGETYARQSLSDEQKKLLSKAYMEVKEPIERVAINADFKEVLENQYIKEYGKIPSSEELNKYIEHLPYPLLSFGRAMSSYSNLKSFYPTLFTPDKVKNALTTIK